METLSIVNGLPHAKGKPLRGSCQHFTEYCICLCGVQGQGVGLMPLHCAFEFHMLFSRWLCLSWGFWEEISVANFQLKRLVHNLKELQHTRGAGF
jgi:hypothetical protein